MVVGVVTAKQFAPRPADELVISSGFIDDDRLVGGPITANGEARKGAGDRGGVFESISYRHYSD